MDRYVFTGRGTGCYLQKSFDWPSAAPCKTLAHFLAVRDVDDLHLDRLAVEDELLAIAQVCKARERERFASSSASMNSRNCTFKAPALVVNLKLRSRCGRFLQSDSLRREDEQ